MKAIPKRKVVGVSSEIINDVTEYIKEYLPLECENIVDSLEFQYNIDEEEYLEQTLENEDEDEMEM